MRVDLLRRSLRPVDTDGATGLRAIATARGASAVLISLLLVGALFPTALRGTPSTLLALAEYSVSISLLLISAALAGVDFQLLGRVSLPIIIVLLLATEVAVLFEVPFATVRLGNLMPFVAVAFLYSLKVKNFNTRIPEIAIAAIGLANLVVGFGIIGGIEWASEFVVHYYSYITGDLVQGMVLLRKPVLSYASHSIAALFLYLFFYINLRVYNRNGKLLYLAIAIGHILLCVALLSHTSFVLSALAAAQVIWCLFRRRPRLTVSVASIVMLLLLFRVDWGATLNLARAFWGDRVGSGFIGRYSESYGTLVPQIIYLQNHFVPIGITDSPLIDPFTIDSGPIDYMLRGSFPLVLLMYGGLWLFLRRNLTSKWEPYHLFAIILATESGIEIMTYYRTFCLLPAFIIILQSTMREQTPRASAAREMAAN